MGLSSQTWLAKFFRLFRGNGHFLEEPSAPARCGEALPKPDALRLSRHVQAFLEGTTDCVFFLDRDWRITFLNQRAMEELRGGKDLLGANLWESFPEAIGTPFEEYCRRAMTEHSLQSFEAYYEPNSAWYEVYSVPVDEGLTVIFRSINERRVAAEALRESERRLATVFGQTMIGFLHRDLDLNVLTVNQRYCEIVGRSREELNGLPMQAFTYAEDAEWNTTVFEKHLETGEPFQIEKRYERPDGSIIWCAVNVSFVRDDRGKIVSTITVAEDITARKAAEAGLIESRRQLATLIDNLPGLVYRCTMEAPWPFSFLSEGAESLTGYTAADFLEQRLFWGEIIHPEDLGKTIEELDFHLKAGRRVYSLIYRIVTRSGEIRWVIDRGQHIHAPSGETAFLEGIVSDITVQKEAEERISWIAHHDSLTQLPNRLLFHANLEKALAQSASTGRKVGLLLIDVDHLQEINDTLGHDAGDAVLQMVAERLTTSVREGDMVARSGGDEFAVILTDIADEQDVKVIIRPLLEQLQKPIVHSGRILDCRTSIGASIWPDHAEEAADLLKQADVALYTAKATGRSKMMIFEPSMRAETQQRVQMRNNAREAVDARRIEPFYQPKVHLYSGRIAGFEALLRWRSKQSGVEMPSTIQAAFDDPHLAVAIGQQMQDLVFGDMRRWLDAGIEFGHVAINASAAEFRSADYAERLLQGLRAAGIPPRYLELEVTETVFLGRGSDNVEKALRTLSKEGVKIALDDFGTGYASLSHLKQFPVDIIKIDRSFVKDLAENSEDTAILQAVLNLGKNLGITTVAEGVETGIQADFLRAQGCDLGQGYLFGKAVPKNQIPELISAWDASPGRVSAR